MLPAGGASSAIAYDNAVEGVRRYTVDSERRASPADAIGPWTIRGGPAASRSRLLAMKSGRYRGTRRATLNQPRWTRAKSAPVQLRIVRFQAAHSGLAASRSRSYQPDESCSTVRKRLRKAKKPGNRKRRDFLDVRISRPVHSTALPPFRARRRKKRLVDPPAPERLGSGDHPAAGHGGGLFDSSFGAEYEHARPDAGLGLVERGRQVRRALCCVV
jgi:hypothetical protein